MQGQTHQAQQEFVKCLAGQTFRKSNRVETKILHGEAATPVRLAT